MQVTIRHSPSNAVARCQLAGGETLKVQPDAMIAHSPGVVLTAGADGGVMKGLKRKVLGGESFFITTYTAPAEGGWVDVATYLLGDMLSLEVSEGHGLLLSRGGWVASSTEISIDAKWGGLKNLMGGEGGFIVRASGAGTMVLACFGALDVWDLAAGETFVLDTNHMVAYDESVEYTLRRAVEGRSVQSMKSGEGWVFEFTGPGRVYGQTRSPQSLTKWLQSTLTGSSSSPTGGGALGSLLTR
ncbi:MAG: hypothetical protein QOE87_1019 [Gaiellales bacterium]|nr:hypothetical protein [Gaiellales bacterium]